MHEVAFVGTHAQVTAAVPRIVDSGVGPLILEYIDLLTMAAATAAVGLDLGIPDDVTFHFCVPLGYPRGAFGPTSRRPTAETTFLDRWDAPVPWA